MTYSLWNGEGSLVGLRGYAAKSRTLELDSIEESNGSDTSKLRNRDLIRPHHIARSQPHKSAFHVSRIITQLVTRHAAWSYSEAGQARIRRTSASGVVIQLVCKLLVIFQLIQTKLCTA